MLLNVLSILIVLHKAKLSMKPSIIYKEVIELILGVKNPKLNIVLKDSLVNAL